MLQGWAGGRLRIAWLRVAWRLVRRWLGWQAWDFAFLVLPQVPLGRAGFPTTLANKDRLDWIHYQKGNGSPIWPLLGARGALGHKTQRLEPVGGAGELA